MERSHDLIGSWIIVDKATGKPVCELYNAHNMLGHRRLNKGDAMNKDKLTSALIQLDQRESTRKGHNPYALALYLQAADDCADMVSNNKETWESAFACCFNPTRGMHAVVRQLGLALDVQRGQWVPRNDE